jgi:general stress protein 26
MSDLKQRIIDIIRKPQLTSMATITEEGKPWVRYVMSFGREDLTIRFASFVNARKVAQIQHNPEVHLTCGVTDPEVMNAYLQIQGKAMLTTDKVEREAFWNEQLQGIFKGPDDPNYGVIIVTPYRIELCSPGKFEPEVWETK